MTRYYERGHFFHGCLLGVLVVIVVVLVVFILAASKLSRCMVVTLTPGHVQRVYDGDTYDVHHYGMPPVARIRVLGVETHELRDTMRLLREGNMAGLQLARLAYEGRDSAAAWIYRAPFAVTDCGGMNLSRHLAWTYRGTDSLHVYLVRLGLGVRR